MIEIKYDGPRVEKYFSGSNYNAMIKAIGLEITRATKNRVNQKRAAANFQAYLQYGLGKPEHLSGGAGSEYSVHLTGNFRLIFEPESENLSAESLSNCKVIKIKGVVDYHGGKTNWLLP